MKLLKNILLTACVIGLLSPLFAARKKKSGVDYKANDMLNRGLEFITQGDKDRGLELIKSIPQQYPSSPVKFKAYQAIGAFYHKKKDYTKAVSFFKLSAASNDEEVQADSYYQSGICYYNLNSYDRAFATLRKVIANYPDSIYANEAFYYIGMCHFKLKRWSRAVEALQLVGTRVTELEKDSIVRAESSQRLFIKIKDVDLVVLPREEGKAAFKVKVVTEKGDSEVIEMLHLGKSNSEFLGSIQTKSAKSAANDGLLQTVGNEKVSVTYVDENTIDGKNNEKLVAKVEMVSTASVGFTDGAYREFVEGVFAGQKFFISVKDYDRDISDKKDKFTIKVAVRYKVNKEEDLSKDGIQLDDDEEVIETRDSMELTLEETAEHSGVFAGSAMVAAGNTPESEKAELSYVNGDYLQMEYTDEVNLTGETRELMTKAVILNSGIQDVRIVHREVDSNSVKAKKELIEAKIFLKLSDIFKNVGLNVQATEKADQGLTRVNNVIDLARKYRLKREITEEAFNVKWDIYIVKDDYGRAIGTCNQLIQLYPDSTLIDKALMRVAQAKMSLETKDSTQDAIKILDGITRLKSSELKPEAQFMIATAREKLALKTARLNGKEANLGSAMTSYKKCLDLFPDSEFAGQSLEKISNFYLATNDYQRTIELMEQVFQDYPDASFLDVMLYKWAYAAYKTGNKSLAQDKAEQLVNDYPNSKFSENATKMIARIGASEKKEETK